MAQGIDWFRWHHGSATDPKFRLVAKKAGARVCEVLAVWAALLESASASEDRGNVGSTDFESVDLALELEDGTAARIYERMCERDLLDASSGRVVAWEKRQPKRERVEDGSSTSRVRAHRDRKRHDVECNAGNDDETPCNANETQETPREEESREKHSEANASEAGAFTSSKPDPKPEIELTRAELWRAGKSLLAEQDMPRAQCGTFVGKLVQDYGDEVVVAAVRSAVVQRPADAASYLKAACQRMKGERGGGPGSAAHVDFPLEQGRKSTKPPASAKAILAKARQAAQVASIAQSVGAITVGGDDGHE